jgi:hypothetical protein
MINIDSLKLYVEGRHVVSGEADNLFSDPVHLGEGFGLILVINGQVVARLVVEVVGTLRLFFAYKLRCFLGHIGLFSFHSQ